MGPCDHDLGGGLVIVISGVANGGGDPMFERNLLQRPSWDRILLISDLPNQPARQPARQLKNTK